MRTGLLLFAAALVVLLDVEVSLPLEPHAATISAVARTASAAPALLHRRARRKMTTSLLLGRTALDPRANLHNRHCPCQVAAVQRSGPATKASLCRGSRTSCATSPGRSAVNTAVR